MLFVGYTIDKLGIYYTNFVVKYLKGKVRQIYLVNFIQFMIYHVTWYFK